MCGMPGARWYSVKASALNIKTHVGAFLCTIPHMPRWERQRRAQQESSLSRPSERPPEERRLSPAFFSCCCCTSLLQCSDKRADGGAFGASLTGSFTGRMTGMWHVLQTCVCVCVACAEPGRGGGQTGALRYQLSSA